MRKERPPRQNVLMTFLKAKQEFGIRYYLWATSDFEREIDESFPYLRSFKTSSGWNLVQFMEPLRRSERLILMNGLLKRFHPKAVQLVGDKTTPEEEEMRDRFLTFSRIPSALDEEMLSRELSGEKIVYAKRRVLRKMILEKNVPALGTDLIRFGDSVTIRSKSSGWVLETVFDFGGMSDQVRYHHSIISESTKKPFGIPTMSLQNFISLYSWLGIRSQTGWKFLMNEDVEPVCNDVTKFCRHFCEVVPKLLKGLEFENITEAIHGA